MVDVIRPSRSSVPVARGQNEQTTKRCGARKLENSTHVHVARNERRVCCMYKDYYHFYENSLTWYWRERGKGKVKKRLLISNRKVARAIALLIVSAARNEISENF